MTKWLSGTRKVLKISLILFCILILLVGVLVTSFGAVVKKSFSVAHMTVFSNLTNIFIFIGVTTVISALIGIYGIILSRKYILIVLSTVVFLGFLIWSMISGILASLRNYQLSTLVKELLNYQLENSAERTGLELIDIVQYQVDCCGLQNAVDWMMSSKWRELHSMTNSCCGSLCSTRSHDGINSNLTFKTCQNKVSHSVRYLNLAIVFTLCVALIQMCLFIGSVFYISSLQDPGETNERIRKKRVSTHVRGSPKEFDKIDDFGRKYLQV